MNCISSALVASSPVPLNLQNTFGVLLVGAIVSVGLLGVATLQAWLYFRESQGDGAFTKIFVAIVWCSEVLRSSFLVQTSYHFLVSNWGNPTVLEHNYWTLDVLSLMTHIIEVAVHSYFIWRIYKLGSAMHWYASCHFLMFLATILTLWAFGLGIECEASSVLVTRASNWVAYETGLQMVLTPIGFAADILTDVAIMLSLIFLLNRGRTGFSKTENLLNTLIFYTVQAGILTVASDIVMLVLNQLINRVGFAYLGIYSIIGNLYANSLLASLNARSSLRTHAQDGFGHNEAIIASALPV